MSGQDIKGSHQDCHYKLFTRTTRNNFLCCLPDEILGEKLSSGRKNTFPHFSSHPLIVFKTPRMEKTKFLSVLSLFIVYFCQESHSHVCLTDPSSTTTVKPVVNRVPSSTPKPSRSYPEGTSIGFEPNACEFSHAVAFAFKTC